MALKILVYTATLVSHEVPSEGVQISEAVQIGERRCNLSGNRLSHQALSLGYRKKPPCRSRPHN